jgi:hypothetical protein
MEIYSNVDLSDHLATFLRASNRLNLNKSQAKDTMVVEEVATWTADKVLVDLTLPLLRTSQYECHFLAYAG